MKQRRLGIFVFFDKDGIVDDYIVYLLDEICKYLERLIVVCNGSLTKDGKNIFERYSNEIFLRENVGFDVAAWQFALVEKVGAENLKKYDQLILFNDTFYGPFYSFGNIFSKMELQNVDFWGITVHGKAYDGWGICEYGYLPEHIQSYFTVYEKQLIITDIFWNYWTSLPLAKSFSEAVCFHEVRQTKFFSDAGYSYSVLCDTRILENGYSYSDNHYIYNPFMLIKNFNCPIVKRKAFITDRGFMLETNSAYGGMQVLTYLQKETLYDVNLIYKHLLRLIDPLFFKVCFHPNYIVNEEAAILPHLKIAIVVKISNISTADIFIRWIANASKLADYFIIYADKIIREKCLNILKTSHVYLFEERQGSNDLFYWQPYINYFTDYDYFGFFNDDFFVKHMGESFSSDLGAMDTIWENMLKSHRYISNVIKLFLADEKLCILVPPSTLYGYNLINNLHPWNKENKKCAEKMGRYGFYVDEKMFEYLPYISNANMWATKSFITVVGNLYFTKELINECKNKEHMRKFLLQIIPYFLKKFGLYGGTVISIDYTRVMLENQTYWLKTFSSCKMLWFLFKRYIKQNVSHSVLFCIRSIKKILSKVKSIIVRF